MIEIRPFAPDMAHACAQLMHEAVHFGASAHYSKAELIAWSPEPMSEADFARRLAGQIALTAWGGEHLLGFMAMEPDGHLDLAYVTPTARGTGVADQLLARIVDEAHARGLKQLRTEASRPAMSFLRRHNWCVIRPNTVFRAGQRLENFIMTFDT